MMKLKCVVIDDEPLARECIGNYIREIDFLELSGSGSNPIELTKLLDDQPVDLVFLDIQMPVMNGIEFLKMTKDPPMVIITTAYPSYALEGFQLDVLDYLVKPITFNRFFKAVAKARDFYLLKNKTENPQQLKDETQGDYFFIRCDSKYERIYFDEILFVEALQNYVSIVTTKGKFMTLLYLKNVERYLVDQPFIRVHKSYIVSMPKIQSIENNEIVLPAHRIPISRNYKDDVLEKVVAGKLWKK